MITLLVPGVITQAQHSFQLSTHMLDTYSGKSAADVEIKLEKLLKDDQWEAVSRVRTNAEGRVGNLLPGLGQMGVYRLTFYTYPYFGKKGVKSIYPYITVVFTLEKGQHYHIPIVVTPYSYSTYRGS